MWRLVAVFVLGLGAVASAAPVPRIVNGTVTADHPAVGAILQMTTDGPPRLAGLCSGTLIGCHTFIAAAHCVCPADTRNATECLAAGTTNPSQLRVFLPHVGILAVASVAINPAYDFGEGGDASVLKLAAPTSGVVPHPINLVGRPPLGTRGRIAGYGSTGGPEFLLSDFGVKRDGPVTTSACLDDVSNETHVCWRYTGTEASTCSGDSGGPLFVDLGTGPVLAGLTSGGESFECRPPDAVFTSDVYVNREWILSQLADDELDHCGDVPPVGEEGSMSFATSAELGDLKPELRLQVAVPPGTLSLRFGLNGQEAGGDDFFRLENDFDLYVRAGVEPTLDDYDCADITYGAFGFCDIANPAPGPWYVLVTRAAGEGRVQLSASSFSRDLSGDANCDDHLGAVDPGALAGIIGLAPADPCEHADANHDGVINALDLAPTISAIFNQPPGTPISRLALLPSVQ